MDQVHLEYFYLGCECRLDRKNNSYSLYLFLYITIPVFYIWLFSFPNPFFSIFNYNERSGVLFIYLIKQGICIPIFASIIQHRH